MVAVAWIGRLQDVDLQLSHASRRVAFAHAHQGLQPSGLEAGADGYLGGPGHAWRTRRGEALLDKASLPDGGPVTVRVRSTGFAPRIQVGDSVSGASRWRDEFRLGGADVWLGEAGVTVGRAGTTGALRDFDEVRLSLRHHTAILTGEGAAGSDEEAQRLLLESGQAWGDLASVSRQRGQAVRQRLQGVDEAWARAQPGWDWVSAWAGEIPSPYLRTWRSP